MDDKEVRIDSGLSTSIHNDYTKRHQNDNISYTNRDKPYADNISHPLGKSDPRPCAIIGPDRVPPSDSNDAYMKTIPVDPWESSDNYRYPYDSIKMADYHQTRNISPRQTFQENMQRINVAPIYSSIKNSDEPSLKNVKLNVPTEVKYCDVPYSINTLSSEQKSVRSDSAMATINPSFSRGVSSHGWHPGGGMQPMKPYQSQDYYQNSEYSTTCTGPRPMPIVQPQRTVHDELLPIYPDRLYQESNIRFKPYPTSKDKFSQSRYEYIGANTFQPPPQIPLHKFDVQKPMHGHHYSMYPQGPYKYIDRRYPEPMMETYPRPPHPQSNTFHNHTIQPTYGPLPSNYYPAKPYPCPSDNSKSMHINKLSYDPNNKIYLELENSRTKGYPSPDNFFYNDRAKFMRGDIIVPHNTPMNVMVQQHLYRKDNSPQKVYDHHHHYRHREHHINLTNPLSRLPMQFSPNTIAISPCDSNTSNETQVLGILQEDCGYASQSSTTSGKSMDSNNSPIDYYKRQVYNFTSVPQHSSQSSNIISRPPNTSDKKSLNVRQFLQMWNEGDDEDSENNNEVHNNTNYVSSKVSINSNQEQLYVLGSVTVPKEELAKYEHLQKVSKLPENIKGYNNIEILNQFEKLVESPNMHNLQDKKNLLKEYKVASKNFSKNVPKEDLRRPVSPLDVEAKISQSVIHKEVGCNFEIKPCSPKVLNVDVATPVHDIIGERLIEKVTNPVLLSIGRGKESNVEKSVEATEVMSCKMINASYSPNNLAAVKPVYPLQDLDTNMGVCLASLPQLDNEIELNLPEVNQQFINANKIERTCTPHPNLSVVDNNNQDTSFINTKINFSSNSDGQVTSYSESDKETIKLSKYRKTKKVETVSNNYNMTSRLSLTQRTDSVIIKNPENVKSQSESFNSFEIENTVTNNIIQTELNKPEVSNNLFNAENVVETAIDFSLSRNEFISGNEKTETLCNLSTSNLIEDSDFYNNSMDMSIPAENLKEKKDCEIVYSNKNNEINVVEDPLTHDSIENIDYGLNIDNVHDNSKLNGEIEGNLIINKFQSDEEFYNCKSQAVNETSDNKTEPDENYKKCSEKTHNYGNNLPELMPEARVTKHSGNMYSNLNNEFNNKIDNINANEARFDRTGVEIVMTETTNFKATSMVDDNEINTSVPSTVPDCDSFIDNVVTGKICSTDLLSKSPTETTYSECNNESEFSNTITGIMSVEGKDNEIMSESQAINIESDNNHFNPDNLPQSECSEVGNKMLSLENVAIEKNHDSCNALIIDKNLIESDISVNSLDISYSKNSNTKISVDLSVDIVDTEEKFMEYGKESSIETKVDVQPVNTIEKTQGRNNSITNNLSISSGHHNFPKMNINYSEENDLPQEDTVKSTYHNNNNEVLNVSAMPKLDKVDHNNLESDDIVESTCCKYNEILALDVSKNIMHNSENYDKFITQSHEENKNCDNVGGEIDDAFKIWRENESENCLLTNRIEETCTMPNIDDVKEHQSRGGKTLNCINHEKRTHKKALLSPWIQKLILYNTINYNENYHLSKNESKKFSHLHRSKEAETCIEECSSSEANENYDNVFNKDFGDAKEGNFRQEFDHKGNNILQECKEKYTLGNFSSNIRTNSKCFVPLKGGEDNVVRYTSPLPSNNIQPKFSRRTSKRSMSDSAIERYYDDTDEQLSCKRFKKYDEAFVNSQMIATNLCNIIQTNRRNSISAIYNDVFILIDKDLILTEDEECENQKVVFTDLETVTNLETVGSKEYNHDSISTIPENLPQDNKELWVDDVGHMETIFGDDVAEDVEISTPVSPKDSISSYETVNNTSFMLCEEVIKNMENDVDYELNMSKNAYSATTTTSSEFYKAQINEIYTSLESQNKEDIFAVVKSESNKKKEENIKSNLDTSNAMFSNTAVVNQDKILDNKENFVVDSNLIQESTTDLFNNKIDSNHNNNLNEKFDDYACTHDSCNYLKYSSSPEVTSTTCEDKNPTILLKISNRKGSKVSQQEIKNSPTKNTISYKLTEKKTYKNYKPNFNSSGTLITKAAQKYIPPIKISMSDLKVKLPLPKNSLDKLKQLKKSKVEPKIDKKPLKSSSLSTQRQVKKQKPKFEDVLMSIDEFQYNKPKIKNKKVRNEIPKVVIKKNETGSHYTSSRGANDQDRNNPDLTGRKWQPWVFLEKNSFIDKMAMKHKVNAIYCRRKNTYVFAEKFRKYKSVYNAKFVISQPKSNDLKKGNLKYTIRLKHNNN